MLFARKIFWTGVPDNDLCQRMKIILPFQSPVLRLNGQSRSGYGALIGRFCGHGVHILRRTIMARFPSSQSCQSYNLSDNQNILKQWHVRF